MTVSQEASHHTEPATTQLILGSVLDRLYLMQGVASLPDFQNFHVFIPASCIHYYPLCDDFGPMNMGCVIRFIEQLDHEMQEFPSSRIFYFVEDGSRNLSNAVFLVGAYLILKMGYSTTETTEAFSWLAEEDIECYRDATFTMADFRLSLQDCWAGLEKGKQLGWVAMPDEQEFIWGMIDVDEYIHYDEPLNGDLHEVVPNKFIAFRGPKSLSNGATHRDHADGSRDFAPRHFADIFADFDVDLVVRLNEPEYNAADFLSQRDGVCHLELGFDDCSPPPADVVERFLCAAHAAAGAVAVHCKAGLGRTGTLIAAYMMKHFSFTAREAMGWLRIMRPGSVIGEQQHYLCELEAAGGDAAKAAQRVQARTCPQTRGEAVADVTATLLGRRGGAQPRFSRTASTESVCSDPGCVGRSLVFGEL